MIFCDLLCIFEVHCQTLKNLHSDPQTKNKNYNWVLRRPFPQPHLAGGVLLGRAYRGCNGEAREREEFEEHLPKSAFECKVTGNKLVGVQWRRWSSGHRRCRWRMAQGRGTSHARAPREREEAPGVALVHGLPLGWPVRGEPELAGGGAEGERRWESVWVRFRVRGA